MLTALFYYHFNELLSHCIFITHCLTVIKMYQLYYRFTLPDGPAVAFPITCRPPSVVVIRPRRSLSSSVNIFLINLQISFENLQNLVTII